MLLQTVAIFFGTQQSSGTIRGAADLNKIDDSSAYLHNDDALFTMDESKVLPGGNASGESVIKMGDGRELQDLWPYGNDAMEMKRLAQTSGFESASALAASPTNRESLLGSSDQRLPRQ